MRAKKPPDQYLDFSGASSLKVVNEYRGKYRKISELLDENPRILTLAHGDWERLLSESSGGRGGYSSEQILRALVVMFVEQDSYRQVVIRIENSEFLRYFVRLGNEATMDYTFLNRAYGALSPETWEAINRVLADYAEGQAKIGGEKLRVDATVYETNIHYPTDSSLLWDSFRTLARVLKQAQQDLPQLGLNHRYHVRKVKKLAYFIARNGGSAGKRKQRKVKQAYRILIDRVRWIVGVSYDVLGLAAWAGYEAEELTHYLPIVERIIDQAEKRVFAGIKVPCEEKIYSLFEEHTELLKRGKARKPIELGHKVVVAQTGEKFIHHYQVLPKRREDTELLDPTLRAHKELFGREPDVLATDKGFYEHMDQIAILEQEIETVSICKKGRRTQGERERESTEAFKGGQRFRAGSEGSISVLKRAFKLGRCLFKGFKHYAASVGCAVFCHNLVLLTRL
jgi:IS5 family transposase